MTITSYSTLVDAIVDRMNDAALEARAPEFIRLAEATFNRRLYNLEAEGVATQAAASAMALPTDFVRMVTLYLDTDPRQLLEPMTERNLRHYWAAQATGRPVNYALTADRIIFGPAPDDTYTVTMTYVRALSPLSVANTTNWLLEDHPDAYLYAALVEAEARGWNNEQAILYNQKVEGIITEINMADMSRRYGSGLKMRPSVIERL